MWHVVLIRTSYGMELAASSTRGSGTAVPSCAPCTRTRRRGQRPVGRARGSRCAAGVLPLRGPIPIGRALSSADRELVN